MPSPRRTIGISAVAAWLAVLAPAWGAPVPAGSDPVYIGVWIEDVGIEFSYDPGPDPGPGRAG